MNEIKEKSCLTRYRLAFAGWKMCKQTNADVSCLCVLFLPPLLLFPSCLRVPTPATFSTPSLPPCLSASTGWAGVHMIKPATQVIT